MEGIVSRSPRDEQLQWNAIIACSQLNYSYPTIPCCLWKRYSLCSTTCIKVSSHAQILCNMIFSKLIASARLHHHSDVPHQLLYVGSLLSSSLQGLDHEASKDWQQQDRSCTYSLAMVALGLGPVEKPMSFIEDILRLISNWYCY